MGIKMEKIIEKVNENQIAIFLVFIAIVTRFLPHPANFTAIGAAAIFSGTYLKRNQALLVPLAAMVASDLFIGMHNLVFFTWGSFVLMGLIGLWVRKNKNVANVVLGTLTGSFLFFFITNTAVWAFTPLYTKNFQGLMQSYVMAIPFFKNSLAGDFFYVGVLFGAYEGAKYMISKMNSSIEANDISYQKN